MNTENKQQLLKLLGQYNNLRIADQIDYKKYYLYSIIAHSTAIEGSTVTEVEAQLLFDDGITSSKRTMMEQLMNLDLKSAYEYGIKWLKKNESISVSWLISLAAKVMKHTGNEYHTALGDFSAAKGELRKLNVTAGIGGKSYMSFQKVPASIEAFCKELNNRLLVMDSTDACAVYDLSFWSHYQLVNIHPWADGNGRTSRLLMNLLQMKFGLLPVKVLKQDKAAYIQALIDADEKQDINVFIDFMASLHINHLKDDIDQYKKEISVEMVDKKDFVKKMVDKWSIKPSLAEKLASIVNYASEKNRVTTADVVNQFGFSVTTTKRYLRQLCEFGFLKYDGQNKGRTYSVVV